MVYVIYIWPPIVVLSAFATIAGVALGVASLDTYKIIGAALWLMNTTYFLFFARENVYLLGVSLAILLMHAVFVLLDGKDHILLTSALFCVVVCINLWGVQEYEIIALTLFVEMATWIIMYFIITI